MIDEILKTIWEFMMSCYNHSYFWHVVIVVLVIIGIFIVRFYGSSTEKERIKRRDRELADKKKRRILKNPFDGND